MFSRHLVGFGLDLDLGFILLNIDTSHLRMWKKQTVKIVPLLTIQVG